MKNTTIENLIDEIRILQLKAFDEHMLESNFAAFEMCINLCKNALIDEKLQIINAFHYAWLEGNSNGLTKAHDYFNNSYKNISDEKL
jgi:hypothetical protein